MHEWRTRKASTIKELEDIFIGMTYKTDWADDIQKVRGVKVVAGTYKTEEEVVNRLASASYGSEYACAAKIVPGKVSKAYQNAEARFMEIKKDYDTFKNNLNIAYGRTSERVTCPRCKSMINTRIAGQKGWTYCPICGSSEIISKSNWDTLSRKRKILDEATDKLSALASKEGIYFIGVFEWHS